MTGKLDALDEENVTKREKKKARREKRRARQQARERRRARAERKAEREAKQAEARAKAEAALADLPEPIKLPAVDTPANNLKRLRFFFTWQMILATCVILIPTLLFSIYQGFVATPRYVAETKFSIRSIGFTAAPDIAQSVLSGVSSEKTELAEQVIAYVRSPAMLKTLESQGFNDWVTAPDIDWWTRLAPDASLEDRVEHYQSFLDIEFEERSAIMTLRTRGFTPRQSTLILEQVVEASEDLVNRVSRALAIKQVEFIEGQAESKRLTVSELRSRIITLQNELDLLDPQGEAAAAAARIAGIQQQLALERVNLETLLQSMDPTSFQVRNVRDRIAALEREAAAQRNALTGTDAEALNNIGEQFRSATLEATLAEQAYALTLQSLETARVEAAQGLKTVVTIVPAELPQEALEPRILFNIFTFFAFSVIAYMVVIIMVMVAREHVD